MSTNFKLLSIAKMGETSMILGKKKLQILDNLLVKFTFTTDLKI